MKISSALSAVALAAASALVLSGCVAGEGSALSDDSAASGEWSTDTLNIDFATYNPLSLIIKEEGWLEDTLDGVEVNWIQSAGSNKANEHLRAGVIDIGSTAGSAALLAKSNGSPIQVVSLYSQPEWSAIVVAADSDISSVEDLRGKKIAATKGTDPYFFLLQALEEHGVGLDEVTVDNLQHADGGNALVNGSVDAWSGLDPIMATHEIDNGAKLIYRNIDFNTYGFLNASLDFIENHPDVVQVVVNAYEKARTWAAENPDESAQILADYSGTSLDVAEKVLLERTNLDVGKPGQTQRDVLEIVGPIFVESDDVDSQQQIDDALEDLINDSFYDSIDVESIKD